MQKAKIGAARKYKKGEQQIQIQIQIQKQRRQDLVVVVVVPLNYNRNKYDRGKRGCAPKTRAPFRRTKNDNKKSLPEERQSNPKAKPDAKREDGGEERRAGKKAKRKSYGRLTSTA